MNGIYMSNLLNMALGMALSFQSMQNDMHKEFEERAELDRQKYWDACKYPRKTKKKMRKEAKADYALHIQLAQPLIYY